MRKKSTTLLTFSVFFALHCTSLIAQESVKLTFFKSGVLEHRTTESFGAKMPEKSIIGLMVSLKDGLPNCNGDLGMALNGKILLIPVLHCNALEVAKTAQKAGAVAVVLIDNGAKWEGSETPQLQIPCLRVETGTGNFYQQQCVKPTLVCLSGSMYSGKIVTNEAPKVKDLSLEEHVRTRVTYSDPNSAITTSSDELMANVRPIATPNIDIDPNAEPAAAPTSTPEIADAVPIYAAVDANPIGNYADFSIKGSSNTPPPSITTEPAVAPTPTASPAPVIVDIKPTQTPNTANVAPTDQPESQLLHNAIEVYPKRVSEILSITYNFEQRTNAQIKISDAAGKVVLEKDVKEWIERFY